MLRPNLFRLANPIQEYAWGSDTLIFEIFGWPQTGQPAAEVWLGAHESAPSLVSAGRQSSDLPSYYFQAQAQAQAQAEAQVPAQNAPRLDTLTPLGTLLRTDPDFMLGRAVTDEYGPRLPYLLKILAAGRPLSLQVHPKPHLARAGFQRENAQEIPLTSALRNYKDASHKPEMLIALTKFEGLCGFRRPQRILELLEPLAGATVLAMKKALTAAPNATGIEQALRLTLALRDVDCSGELSETIESIAEVVRAQCERGERISRGHLTAIDLAVQYPGDPGALVSLMLNRTSLLPGESVYLGAGQIHAYLGGLGVEVMASSDNVLRAGLTPKRVDVAELMTATDFAPAAPTRPTLRSVPGGLTQYRSPAAEFAILQGKVVGTTLVTQSGPRVVLCLSGVLTATAALGESHVLSPGQSLFVPHGAGDLTLITDGDNASVVISYVP